MEYKILQTIPGQDYELLDSGENYKLERYGKYVVARPDPQALWKKNLSVKDWERADATFVQDSRKGEWKIRNKNLPKVWDIDFGSLRLNIRLSSFKHTGIFPEQAENWSWLMEKIKNSDKKVNVLNLFGYTGGATLACAKAGAEVVHVDGSKVAIGWARENVKSSGLEDKPVRWILDDAVKFVQREIKRGHKYDGIIMDPPAFGHGPGGEMWKIEEDFIEFLDLCKQILSDKPLFFLINGYASGYSAIAYKNDLENIMKKYLGEIEIGELTIQEKSGRLLPCGIFARWSSKV